MVDSFRIFLIAALVIVGLFVGFKFLVIFGDLIICILACILGIGLFAGGLVLLTKVGGGWGAFGIFLMIIGVSLVWGNRSSFGHAWKDIRNRLARRGL
jgi:hypothetical protein